MIPLAEIRFNTNPSSRPTVRTVPSSAEPATRLPIPPPKCALPRINHPREFGAEHLCSATSPRSARTSHLRPPLGRTDRRAHAQTA